MSNVTLWIGGRSFTVACAKGEEAHVTELGRMIDAKVSNRGELSGQSETRMLLFAALLLADELHDASARLAELPVLPDTAGRQLDAIAERLENLAGHLERTASSA